jgi:hypothetical protein
LAIRERRLLEPPAEGPDVPEAASGEEVAVVEGVAFPTSPPLLAPHEQKDRELRGEPLLDS